MVANDNPEIRGSKVIARGVRDTGIIVVTTVESQRMKGRKSTSREAECRDSCAPTNNRYR